MNKKILIIIIAVLVLLIVLVGVLVFVLSGSSSPEASDKPQQTKVGMGYQQDIRVDFRDGSMVHLGDFTANMVNNDGSGKYVIVSMSAQASDAAFAEVLMAQNTVVRDTVLKALSLKSFSQIATPEGKKRIKEEIKDSINAMSNQGHILEIYFTKFMVQ
jgi:flagellar FliL protein